MKIFLIVSLVFSILITIFFIFGFVFVSPTPKTAMVIIYGVFASLMAYITLEDCIEDEKRNK